MLSICGTGCCCVAILHDSFWPKADNDLPQGHIPVSGSGQTALHGTATCVPGEARWRKPGCGQNGWRKMALCRDAWLKHTIPCGLSILSLQAMLNGQFDCLTQGENGKQTIFSRKMGVGYRYKVVWCRQFMVRVPLWLMGCVQMVRRPDVNGCYRLGSMQ